MPPEPPSEPSSDPADQVVNLPPRSVLEAGVDKFLELTHIGVAKAGEQFAPFDFRNRQLLTMVLGLTYLHMQARERERLHP